MKPAPPPSDVCICSQAWLAKRCGHHHTCPRSGKPDAYAGWHEHGSRSVPPRPFVPLTAVEAGRLQDRVSAELRDAIRGSVAYAIRGSVAYIVTLPCGHRGYEGSSCSHCTTAALAADPPPRTCCSPVWSAAPGGHKPECSNHPNNADRAPDRMRADETDADWWQNPRRLPWCAVCKKTIPAVQVKRMGMGGEDADRLFTVSCHGACEETRLTAAEVKAMHGYGRAFASRVTVPGVRSR